jgi:hypothetical protein
MKIRNPRKDCIANVPYDLKPGVDPQPIEIYPEQEVELPDDYFDHVSDATKQAFLNCLKACSLELTEPPKDSKKKGK